MGLMQLTVTRKLTRYAWAVDPDGRSVLVHQDSCPEIFESIKVGSSLEADVYLTPRGLNAAYAKLGDTYDRNNKQQTS